MGTHTFTSGARFTYEGRLHEVVRLLPGQTIRVEDLASREERSIEERVLMQAACDGALTFVAGGRAAAPADDRAAGGFLDWADYPPHLRAIAEYREAVILPLLDARWSGQEARARVAAVRATRVADERDAVDRTMLRTLSVRSVTRWLARYTACGNDIRALVPRTGQRGGKGRSRLGEQGVDRIIDAVLRDVYYRNPHTPIKRLREHVIARLAARNAACPEVPPLRAPSWATVRRRVAALPPGDVLAAREGRRAARRHLQQVGEAPEPERPLARVEIDHMVVPVIVIDERDNLPLGLPVLTYALDVATRYPLGYYLGFEPFSYYAVMECLYHAIRPKDPEVARHHGCAHDWLAYGVPAELFTDNGREFKGHDLRDACRPLGIHLRHTPVRTPEFKGTIERHFQRVERDLFGELPGAVFDTLRRRGGYASIENACLALGDLDRLLYRWIVDVYAHEPHAGLAGTAPADRWLALTADAYNAIRRAPGSAEDLKILLSRGTTRTVQRYGIDFMTLRYNAQELGPLRGELVKVKYHPGDLSQLYVLEPAAGRYLTVPALARQYTQGLTLWTHRLLKEQRLAEQGTVDMAGLQEAKAAFQQVIAAAKARKRLNHRVARARTGGAPAGSLGAAPAYHAPVAATPAPQPPATMATAPDDALEALLAGLTPEAPGWALSRPSAADTPRRTRGEGRTR